jgi:hypothetical protein
VEQDGGGRRDAEGVDLGGDRDRQLEVGGGEQLGRQTVSLVADHEDPAVRAKDGAQRAGARGDGGGEDGGAVRLEEGEGCGEIDGEGERLGEAVAHGGPDRPALEGVGAAAVEEDEVDGEGAGAAEDGAEVLRVGEALDQQDGPARGGEQVERAGWRRGQGRSGRS